MNQKLFAGIFFLPIISSAQLIYDADGNSYGTVNIGTQVWMSRSLETTHFLNGDSIPTTFPPTLSVNTESAPLYQWAYNGNDSLTSTYGRLYTWYVTIDPRNVCPAGWHVPSSEEFRILENFLGGKEVAGGKLKQEGFSHWNSPNTGGSNQSGFNGVPNGNRNLLGYFNDMGIVSDMWSTTEGDNGAWDCDLYYNTEATLSHDDPKGFAFAIRCVRDLPAENDLSEIELFPVPSENELSVDCKSIYGLNFTVYNATGQPVLAGTLTAGISVISLIGLPAGVYILRIEDTVNHVEHKFTKIN